VQREYATRWQRECADAVHAMRDVVHAMRDVVHAIA
jgi:hypothetical protein